jgi:ADP-heptose:LPS heptosyltransferase
MLCVVPLLRALHHWSPKASITLMASPVNIDVMRNNRYLAKLINYDKREFLASPAGPVRYLKFIGRLRAERFDLAIVPMTVSISFTSCLLALLSGARVRIGARRIDGRMNTAAPFFHLPVDLDWRQSPERHQALRNLDTARPLQLRTEDITCEITLLPDEQTRGASFVAMHAAGKTCRIAFHPGAGKPGNRWPAECFGRIADRLVGEFKGHAFVTKGDMDGEPVRLMLEGMRNTPTVIDGKPIREVAAILAQMDLVISNDTGIMHVAAAVGAPVLSLFGPTNPAQWAPVAERHRYLSAPSGDMTSISEEEVLNHARQMLAGTGGRR